MLVSSTRTNWVLSVLTAALLAWVVIGMIWAFCSAFTVILFPLWESREALTTIGRGIVKVRRESVVADIIIYVIPGHLLPGQWKICRSACFRGFGVKPLPVPVYGLRASADGWRRSSSSGRFFSSLSVNVQTSKITAISSDVRGFVPSSRMIFPTRFGAVSETIVLCLFRESEFLQPGDVPCSQGRRFSSYWPASANLSRGATS